LSAVEHAHHEPVALAWSGGKDSALALQALWRDGCAVSALLTTVTEGYERISMHGVRRELLRRQSARVGVPLVEVRIPPACTNAAYEERMTAALASPPLDAVRTVAFGDLFLEDVRRYREERLATAGRRALFPLWGLDTRRLALDFVEAGFEALVCCVDPSRLDASFAGSAFDHELVAALPTGVDPCGENGEFHTFVHAGPVLREPVGCRRGRVVERDGFVFCDLLPA
jgi:uncharacterized protein (TIGR00290 family)